MKKIMAGLLAIAWLVAAIPMAAQAGEGFVTYKQGVVESAVAKGQTVLVFYKSTW